MSNYLNSEVKYVLRVINSCETIEQLESCRNWADDILSRHGLSLTPDFVSTKLIRGFE